MASYRRTGSNLYDMVDRFLNDGFSVNTPLRNIILDVQEFDDHYLVEADVPGVDKKDIDVTFNNDYLKIAVDDRHENEDKAEGANNSKAAANETGADNSTTGDATSDAQQAEDNANTGDASKGSTNERREPSNETQSHYIHRERLYATLNRVIYLKGATSKGIKAELKDGVLTLNVPKREDAMNQNQKIAID